MHEMDDLQFGSREDLERAGFAGFEAVHHLRSDRCRSVPTVGGVYLVVRASGAKSQFRTSSPAGRFKGRDPTIPVEELEHRWNTDTCVLYVGKAGGGGMQATLQTRLSDYLRHGAGSRAAHWGGRAVWQLADSADLLIAWRPCLPHEDPREMERALIAAFVKHYGRRPFANRAG